MKINKQWHEEHPMPKNPTEEQRIVWHVEHFRACRCREVPESIREKVEKQLHQ